MNYSSAFAISAAGMTLERTRVEVAALNLANAHTTASAGQTPYVPLRVIATSAQLASFASLMTEGAVVSSVPKTDFRVEAAAAAPRLVHEPGHPLADERGFVKYPGVDTATEMVSLMSASRAYEANVAAMNTSRTLALKALDIGGGA